MTIQYSGVDVPECPCEIGVGNLKSNQAFDIVQVIETTATTFFHTFYILLREFDLLKL